MAGWDYSRTAPFGTYENDIGVIPRKVAPNMPNAKVTIGNDVWIGQDVLLKPGITIGDGAVIGARSVVTKDVPDCAVYAGVPAVFKRFRFNDDTVARYCASKWWEYGYEQFDGMDTTDPLPFLDAFEEAKAAGAIKSFPYKPVELHAKMRAIV